MPRSLQGSDDLDNLALACHRCNEQRNNSIAAIDPQDEIQVSLFNPRKEIWSDHFCWSSDSVQIIGKTATGRATCDRLDLNDKRYPEEDSIRSVRRLWASAGWHPPEDDPIEGDRPPMSLPG